MNPGHLQNISYVRLDLNLIVENVVWDSNIWFGGIETWAENSKNKYFSIIPSLHA